MNSFFSLLTILALLRTVSSLDVVVTGPMMCDTTLPISFNFTSLNINDIKILTFGQTFPVEGYFVYENLSRSYPLDADSIVRIDARIKFGYGMSDVVLEDSPELPLCWLPAGITEHECPGDGMYPFSGQYPMMTPSNEFLEWAAVGFSGELAVTFSVYGDIVGECSMAVKTRRRDYYSEETEDVKKNEETGDMKKNVQSQQLSGYETFLAITAAMLATILIVFSTRVACRYCGQPQTPNEEIKQQKLVFSPVPTKLPLLITTITDSDYKRAQTDDDDDDDNRPLTNDDDNRGEMA